MKVHFFGAARRHAASNTARKHAQFAHHVVGPIKTLHVTAEMMHLFGCEFFRFPIRLITIELGGRRDDMRAPDARHDCREGVVTGLGIVLRTRHGVQAHSLGPDGNGLAGLHISPRCGDCEIQLPRCDVCKWASHLEYDHALNAVLYGSQRHLSAIFLH